ncbi:MAG: hypothetical protein H7A25_10495 [Leptospiraceae bacterium]|nr:hypothetical protein [Leptospiraceae bacterium]
MENKSLIYKLGSYAVILFLFIPFSCTKKKDNKDKEIALAAVALQGNVNAVLEQQRVTQVNQKKLDPAKVVIDATKTYSLSDFQERALLRSGAVVADLSISPKPVTENGMWKFSPNTNYTFSYTIESYLSLKTFIDLDYNNHGVHVWRDSLTGESCSTPVEGDYSIGSSNSIKYSCTVTYSFYGDKSSDVFISLGFIIPDSKIMLYAYFPSGLPDISSTYQNAGFSIQSKISNTSSKTSQFFLLNESPSSTEEKEKLMLAVGVTVESFYICELSSNTIKIDKVENGICFPSTGNSFPALIQNSITEFNFITGKTYYIKWSLYSFSKDLKSSLGVKYSGESIHTINGKLLKMEENIDGTYKLFVSSTDKLNKYTYDAYYTVPTNKISSDSMTTLKTKVSFYHHFSNENSRYMLAAMPAGVIKSNYATTSVSKQINVATTDLGFPMDDKYKDGKWVSQGTWNFGYIRSSDNNIHKGVDLFVSNFASPLADIPVTSICGGKIVRDNSKTQDLYNAFFVLECSGKKYNGDLLRIYYGHAYLTKKLTAGEPSLTVSKGEKIGTVRDDFNKCSAYFYKDANNEKQDCCDSNNNFLSICNSLKMDQHLHISFTNVSETSSTSKGYGWSYLNCDGVAKEGWVDPYKFYSLNYKNSCNN